MGRYSVGFLGCGHMGGALAQAVAKSLGPQKVAICEKNEERAAEMSVRLGVVATTMEDLGKNSEWIFLGIKPQSVAEVLPELGEILQKRQDRFVIVSMVTALTMERICELLGQKVPVIRILPNTPVEVGQGMTLVAKNDLVTAEEESVFREAMSESGVLISLAEERINAGCSVSGCGPAFVFLFLEAMTAAGVECGLTKEEAETLAIQTLIGSASLLRETGADAGDLRRAVCSPGGTTIEGIRVLEDRQFVDAVMAAVQAAYARNKELAN